MQHRLQQLFSNSHIALIAAIGLLSTSVGFATVVKGTEAATPAAEAPVAASPEAAPQDLSQPVGPDEVYEEDVYEMIKVEKVNQEELLDKPMNLARWVMGAKLYTFESGHLNMADEENFEEASPSVLLTKDPKARYPMYVDSYKFVIDLGDYWMINMFEFMNYGAQGRAQVFYSDVLQDPNSGQWKAASPIVPFSSDGKISMYLGALDTRYVMLVIDNMARGEIGPFAVYGDLKISEMRLAGGGLSQKELDALPMTEQQKYRPVRYDWATLHSGCRVSHVSSGDPRYSNSIIDDDLETIHQFKQEPETIVIMDLMEERDINRMSMLFSSDPGLFEIYFVHKLPGDMRTEAGEIEAVEDVEAERNKSGDSAGIMQKGLPQGMLLAAAPGSLGELMALSQLGQHTSNTTDEIPITITHMPKEFFKSTKPHLTYVSDGGAASFRIEFQEMSGRWAIIRYRRNFNSPEQYGMNERAPALRAMPTPIKVSPYAFAPSPLTMLGQSGAEGSETSNGLRIYEVSIFGEIFFTGNALEPVDGVHGNGSESTTGGGTPGGGGGPGGGGTPIPPVSPPPPITPPPPPPPVSP